MDSSKDVEFHLQTARDVSPNPCKPMSWEIAIYSEPLVEGLVELFNQETGPDPFVVPLTPEIFAELTGAEWGMVAAGAAASLCHAAAGCVTGGDPEKLMRLPDTEGLKDRVLTPKGGRFAYDHAIRATGVEIVEVENLDELDGQLDGQVAMLILLGTHEPGWFAPLTVGPRTAQPARVRHDAVARQKGEYPWANLISTTAPSTPGTTRPTGT